MTTIIVLVQIAVTTIVLIVIGLRFELPTLHLSLIILIVIGVVMLLPWWLCARYIKYVNGQKFQRFVERYIGIIGYTAQLQYENVRLNNPRAYDNGLDNYYYIEYNHSRWLAYASAPGLKLREGDMVIVTEIVDNRPTVRVSPIN